MNIKSKKDISEILSLYLDGELSDQEMKEVEELVTRDAEAARELNELRSMKQLFASKQRLPETLGFWTRLSTALEQRKKEEENLLPFPRKFLPYVTIGGAVAVLVIALILFQQRGDVVEYVSKQSEQVQKAFEGQSLQASLFPLFSNVDKNQVLQFALFGTLPLDAKAETALRVDESADKGYRIDVGRKTKKSVPAVTVRDLYSEIKPTSVQIEIIDSLLDLGKSQIEKSVFFAEDKAIAIDPNLPKLNRLMLASIAATLEPRQRVRFEKFLKIRNAPFMVTVSNQRPERPEKIFGEIRRAPKTGQFIVVTPETLVLSQMNVDFDRFEQGRQEFERMHEQMRGKINVLIRKFTQHETEVRVFAGAPQGHGIRVFGSVEQGEVRAGEDPDFITIEIGRAEETQMPHTWVQRRIPPPPFEGEPRARTFNYRFSTNDSAFNYEIRTDSIFEQMFRAPGGRMNFDDLEAMIEGRRARLGIPPDQAKIDSIMTLFRSGKMSFDSLMKEIRQDEVRGEEEVRQKRIGREF